MPQQYFDDNPLDGKFRAGLKDLEVTPRKRVWNRIANNLNQTNKNTELRRGIVLSVGALSLVAVIVVALFVPESTTTKLTQNKVREASSVNVPLKNNTNTFQNIQQPVVSPINEPATGDLNAVQNNSSGSLVTLNHSIHHVINYLDDVLEQLNDKSTSPSPSIQNNERIYPLTNKPAILPAEPVVALIDKKDLTSDFSNTSIKIPASSFNPSVNYCLKGFYAGLGAAVNTTKMNDSKALSNTDFKYKFTLGTAFSVNGGYNFSNLFGIETGLIINSVEGQKYTYLPQSNTRIDPSFKDDKITLNYTQVPLLGKLKFGRVSRITHHPAVLNVEIGGQFGYLKSVTRSYSNEFSNSSQFKNKELAGVTGIEYDVYFTQKAFFSLGVKASYGSNIYKSQIPVYNEFAAPHNIVAGVNIGISYSFSTCK